MLEEKIKCATFPVAKAMQEKCHKMEQALEEKCDFTHHAWVAFLEITPLYLGCIILQGMLGVFQLKTKLYCVLVVRLLNLKLIHAGKSTSCYIDTL